MKTIPIKRCYRKENFHFPLSYVSLPVAAQLAALPASPLLTFDYVSLLLSFRNCRYSPVFGYPRLDTHTLAINRCILFVILVCSEYLYCVPVGIAVVSLN